jgi:DNA-binding CsgD family transcriptional regulator
MAVAICRYLARRGLVSSYTGHAHRAQARLQRGNYDLLLVDLPEGSREPPWDWPALAASVSIPVVVLQPAVGGSAYPGRLDRQLTALQKPVSWDSVARTMAAVLTGNGAQHQPSLEGPERARQTPAHLPPDLKPLSPREQEALWLLIDGLPNRAIAEAMGLSEPTVKKHVQRIIDKLRARDRTHAAVIALRAGLAE